MLSKDFENITTFIVEELESRSWWFWVSEIEQEDVFHNCY